MDERCHGSPSSPLHLACLRAIVFKQGREGGGRSITTTLGSEDKYRLILHDVTLLSKPTYSHLFNLQHGGYYHTYGDSIRLSQCRDNKALEDAVKGRCITALTPSLPPPPTAHSSHIHYGRASYYGLGKWGSIMICLPVSDVFVRLGCVFCLVSLIGSLCGLALNSGFPLLTDCTCERDGTWRQEVPWHACCDVQYIFYAIYFRRGGYIVVTSICLRACLNVFVILKNYVRKFCTWIVYDGLEISMNRFGDDVKFFCVLLMLPCLTYVLYRKSY